MVAVGAGMLLTFAPTAAQAAQPVWTCRASAVAATGLTPKPVEPIVANNTPTGGCVDSDTTQGVGQSGLDASGGFAQTSIDPDNVPAAVQSLEAKAGVDAASIGNGQGFALSATHVESDATATCAGNTPSFGSSGQVGTVTINGNPVSTDSTITQVGDGVNGSPLGGLIQVHFNEVTQTASGLIRRGVHVQILDATGATVYDAVIGEAKVASQGLTCSPGIPDGGCPTGSVELNGVCIITVPIGGGHSTTVTILGANPGGGFITSPSLLPSSLAHRGPCSKKSLHIVDVIIGTKHGDRITGTNKNDRIMSLGGRDRVSGGRGNDCVEAGGGNDQLDGSNDNDRLYGQTGKDIISGASGKDRLYGGRGNDKLTGGSGNDYESGGVGRDKLTGDLGADRLVGGNGNDYINTDNGRDRVSAGKGNDAVNASTAGRPARINCGKGRDTVRLNHNEMKRAKGCERELVTHRV
jgi:Ca2+-binding RTX toxin-like protein